MKFVDEVLIKVTAGKGGNGCASFRREKFIPFGGPNGGDGGLGGSVYLIVDTSLSTLIDFRYQRHYQATSGESGRGSDCYGKGGKDIYLKVPPGTAVYDVQTAELLDDLIIPDQCLKVAQGGAGGLGNIHFKSSVNRAPRQFTTGKLGEHRALRLELKLLAEVGLAGLPNAGKSTFIRAVSAARPKVADYPFTTLHPQLGVVSIAPHRSFVIADIPGLIEGAAEGAGLGIQFLRHLQRTKILLHIIDVTDIDPIVSFQQVSEELAKFDPDLLSRPRWLVLNKMDVLPQEEHAAYLAKIKQDLAWTAPAYAISGLTGWGTQALTHDLMQYLESFATFQT